MELDFVFDSIWGFIPVLIMTLKKTIEYGALIQDLCLNTFEANSLFAKNHICNSSLSHQIEFWGLSSLILLLVKPV